jgi:ubiquinone biosynthesis protein
MSNFAIDLRRALVLSGHGLRLSFGILASRLGSGKRPEVLVRQTFQRLGMTGLKLGQFLALRSDLFPPHVTRELSLLFETVAPMDFGFVRGVIESDLGEPITNLFSEFEPVSIAAASIAQVHLARTREGERVAVKVQRPGLVRQFDADMRNLRRLALVMDAAGLLGKLSIVDAVDEFARYTKRELDFITEGETADRLRAGAACGEIVPKIHWGLTCSRVLTMDYIEGVSLGRAGSLIAAGNERELYRLLPDLDLPLAMHNLATASWHQLYVTGFFHADPHPGNILLCPGNRIAFLDFGIFGEVSPMQKEVLARYLEELIYGNIDQAARLYSRIYAPTEKTDMAAFQVRAKVVLRRMVEALESAPTAPASRAKDRLVARFSDEMVAEARREHLRISVDTLLFWRAVIVLDGTLLQLWPGFDMMREVRQFFARYRPGILDRTVQFLTPERHLATLMDLAMESAGKVDQILSDVVAGRFEAKIVMKESPQTRRLENRRVRGCVLGLAGISVMFVARLFSHGPAQEAVWSAALACFGLSLLYLLRQS